MKFVSYLRDSKFRAGLLVNGTVVDIEEASGSTGKATPFNNERTAGYLGGCRFYL